jgi:hypothetical protein
MRNHVWQIAAGSRKENGGPRNEPAASSQTRRRNTQGPVAGFDRALRAGRKGAAVRLRNVRRGDRHTQPRAAFLQTQAGILRAGSTSIVVATVRDSSAAPPQRNHRFTPPAHSRNKPASLAVRQSLPGLPVVTGRVSLAPTVKVRIETKTRFPVQTSNFWPPTHARFPTNWLVGQFAYFAKSAAGWPIARRPCALEFRAGAAPRAGSHRSLRTSLQLLS